MVRCDTRAKNGADFLLAFEAGKVAQAFSSDRGRPPIILIVSSDAGLNIVVKELNLAGIPAFLLLIISELDVVVNNFAR